MIATAVPRFNLLDDDPERVKLLAVIRQTRDQSHQGVCKRLDFESVKPLECWVEDFGVKTWSDAYLHDNCGRRIRKAISTFRKKIRESWP